MGIAIRVGMIMLSVSTWSQLSRLYALQLPLEREALRVLASMLDLDESSRLLDVATGTGAMLSAAARVGSPPRQATGLDSSPKMLARVPPLPVGWQLICANAAAVPVPDASFDRVSLAYLLHFLDAEGRASVLAEAHRILTPGGLLGTVTVAPPAGRPARLLRAPVEAMGSTSTGPLAGLRSLDPRPDLEQAGFISLRGRHTRRGYPSLCVVATRS
jgi:ubiquinone/menaquinone biosynthesis C-methylase UbiE